MSDPRWMTVKEYAALMRVTEETVRRWIRAKKVVAQRTTGDSGHWRILSRHAA